MKDELVVRADASAQIGTGHVMRCLALAQAWQETGGDVTFVTTQQAPELNERLIAEGMRVVWVQASPGSAADAEFTRGIAHSQNVKWLVLDGYHFDAAYQQILRESGLCVLYLDDNGELESYCADVVLNQNVHATKAMYAGCVADTRLLLGTRYALLRREFWKWRGWERTIAPVAKRVLVTLGGSDPGNVTPDVIRALTGVKVADLDVVVVVGGSNPHLQAIRDKVAQSGLNIRIEENVTDMPALMAWADIAISGAGSTCWELAFLGLPGIVLVLAENQRRIAAELDRRGIAQAFGTLTTERRGELAAQLTGLCLDAGRRTGMAQQASRIVDGNGGARVVRELQGSAIRLRRVEAQDRRLIWEWANDAGTRASSFSSAWIAWDEHVRWFDEKLSSPTCFFYLAMDEVQTPLGQIRFEVAGREAVVSLSIGPLQRGRGYGTHLIARGAEELFATSAGRKVGVIHAYIKPENEISLRAFLNAGYKKGERAMFNGYPAEHLILERDECGF